MDCRGGELAEVKAAAGACYRHFSPPTSPTNVFDFPEARSAEGQEADMADVTEERFGVEGWSEEEWRVMDPVGFVEDWDMLRRLGDDGGMGSGSDDEGEEDGWQRFYERRSEEAVGRLEEEKEECQPWREDGGRQSCLLRTASAGYADVQLPRRGLSRTMSLPARAICHDAEVACDELRMEAARARVKEAAWGVMQAEQVLAALRLQEEALLLAEEAAELEESSEASEPWRQSFSSSKAGEGRPSSMWAWMAGLLGDTPRLKGVRTPV